MVTLDWNRIFSSVAMIEYLICSVIFLVLSVEFLKNNRREAKAVGIVFLGGGIKSLLNITYRIIHDGLAVPTWFSAMEQIPVLLTLLYLMYVLISELKDRKENGKHE